MHLDLELIISQIIAFALTLLILKRFAWKPLLRVLEERRQKIQFEFDSLAKQRKDAQHLIDDYESRLHNIEEQARARMQAAASEGLALAEQMRQEAQKQAKAILDKATADIQREIVQAKAQLKEDIVKIVGTVTQKLISNQLNEDGQQKLIADFVDQVGFE